MSNNLLWPSQGPANTQQFIKTTETAGVHVQHTIVDSGTVTIDPGTLATAAKQDAQTALLTTIDADTGALALIDFATGADIATVVSALGTVAGHVDGLEALLALTNGYVDGLEGLLTSIDADTGALALVDFATQTTLAAILAKIIAAPATEAKQDTIITHIDGLETLITATNAKDFATQATLAAVLAKIIAAPATEAKQDTGNTSLASIVTAVQLIDNVVKQEDDASANLDYGIPILARRTATPANTSGTDADYEMLQISAGRLWGSVVIDTALPAGTAAIGKFGHDTTGIGDGVKTVATAGTDEVLASSTPCKWVMITAQTDNTNYVAVGASGVDATSATGDGIPLAAGDSVFIMTDNLADIYVDSLVNGEGVRYIYGT